MAYNASLLARNKTSMYKIEITLLLREISEFFDTKAAKPSEIKKLAEAVSILFVKITIHFFWFRN